MAVGGCFHGLSQSKISPLAGGNIRRDIIVVHLCTRITVA